MRRLLAATLPLLVMVASAPADARVRVKVRMEPVRQAPVLAGVPQRIAVEAPRRARWTLTVRRGNRELARTRGRGARTVAVRLRARPLRGCTPKRLVAVLRVGRRVVRHRRRLRLDPVRCRPAAQPEGEYLAGAASRSIAPAPEHGTVYLGGYGIGGGSPGFEGRAAEGTFPDGIEARAVAITGGDTTLVLADVELQGWFAAHEDDALAIRDVRRTVAERSGGAVDPQRVIVQSNHSHSAPDLLGAWGGASRAYRAFVFEQTVAVILEALDARRPGRLRYGTAPAADLLTNQFDYDPANATLDDELRVLQAVDRRGRPLVTILNHNAHATVLGSGNRLASGDWTTRANALLEQALGGRAVTLMGTLGRTQPDDRRCDDAPDGLEGDRCTVDRYAQRVVARAREALDAARPLDGPARVDGRSYLVIDASTNPFVLGLQYAGGAAGAQLVRSRRPPWLLGTILGTTTASARIGDVLLSAIPGEAYPQIPAAVRAATPGIRGHMTMGLANDQLGYLIAPLSAYPEPIRRTLFNERGDEISPVDNDNYLFNVSLTMGERVICSLLRGAGEVLPATPRARDECAPFAADRARPAGADVE